MCSDGSAANHGTDWLNVTGRPAAVLRLLRWLDASWDQFGAVIGRIARQGIHLDGAKITLDAAPILPAGAQPGRGTLAAQESHPNGAEKAVPAHREQAWQVLL